MNLEPLGDRLIVEVLEEEERESPEPSPGGLP
jgi:co-chaperonin GroES (HSP10)